MKNKTPIDREFGIEWLNEQQLDNVVGKATRAALDVLDAAFPGKNKGGITDADAFGLHNFLMGRLRRFVGEVPSPK